MAKITIKDLLEAGVHFGHQKKRWNPKMKPYIYGARNGISIFDLTKTMRGLAEACQYLSEIAAAGDSILFVGSKRQAQEIAREAAEKTGQFFMCDRWLGGTLTNFKVVLSRVNHLKKLQKMEADGSFDGLPKKEVAGHRREMSKLQRTLGGIADMGKLPAVMIVIDVNREQIAVKEANKLGIPVIALVDSNCNPDPVDYVVAGNDDALRSIKVITEAFTAAIQDGLMVHGKDSKSAKKMEKAEKPAVEQKAAEEKPAAKAEEKPAEKVEEAPTAKAEEKQAPAEAKAE